MKCLLIVASVYGNTRQIAEAVAKGVKQSAETEICDVTNFTIEKIKDFQLVVVGSPTRGFRPTPEIAGLLKNLPAHSLDGKKVAAFDTRILLTTIKSSFLRFIVDKGGYAANTIAKSLQKKGGILVLPPEGFFVLGEEGPLKDGELERAEKWASNDFFYKYPSDRRRYSW